MNSIIRWMKICWEQLLFSAPITFKSFDCGTSAKSFAAMSIHAQFKWQHGARWQWRLLRCCQPKQPQYLQWRFTGQDHPFSSSDERWLTADRRDFTGAILEISFQSDSEGNVLLPSLFFNAALRIYDVRRPVTNSKCSDMAAVFQSWIKTLIIWLNKESVSQFLQRQSSIKSAMLSPVDSNQLVCAESDGVFVIDIRKPNERVCMVRYSEDGSRLLCSSEEYESAYDLFPNKKLVASDKVSLNNQ